MRSIVLALLCASAFVGLIGSGPGGTWPFVGYPTAGAVTPTPQVTMNVFAVVQANQTCGGATCNPIDMGPTPDNFVDNADWNQEPAPTGTSNYCGTTAAPNCVVYKYIDHMRNFCQTTQTQQVLIDAGLPATFAPGTSAPSGAETWFTHFATTNPVPTAPGTPFRNIAAEGGAACAPYWGNLATPTAPPTGVSFYTLPFLMNPDDAGFRGELQNCCWTNTGANFYPQTQNATSAPMNVYEDNGQFMGRFITGGSGKANPFASEYGCWFGVPNGQTCRNDLVGTNPFHGPDAWGTAVGLFANSACGSPCLKMTLNGASPGGNINVSCNVWNGTNHCHDQVYTGYIDNTFINILAQTITANSSANITYFDMESPIFDHVTSKWGQPALLSAVLNTWINFQQNATFNGVKISDLEPGWGSGGVGDTTTDVRTMTLGMEWLAPDYSGTKSSNDRIVSRLLPIGGSRTESPSFFEHFLVPFAPEQQAAPYVMHNDSTQTTSLGSGCAGGVRNAQGDVHGIIDLLVACASDNGGVYVQQYQQLWFNGHNYGALAVIVNTSSSDTIPISSGWFTILHPATTFNWKLTLLGSEMESVAQGNIGGGTATFTTCTNVLYCATGNNTVAANTTAWSAASPGSIGPHSAVILLATNS